MNLNDLLGKGVFHPLYGITEAIKREAFFQQEIIDRDMSMRELYMMLDIAFRPGQHPTILKAVDDMLSQLDIQ